MPRAAAYLWEWFLELSAARAAGGFGPAAITYPDIFAWSQLTGRAPAPWEVALLKQLDAVFIQVMAAGRKK